MRLLETAGKGIGAVNFVVRELAQCQRRPGPECLLLRRKPDTVDDRLPRTAHRRLLRVVDKMAVHALTANRLIYM